MLDFILLEIIMSLFNLHILFMSSSENRMSDCSVYVYAKGYFDFEMQTHRQLAFLTLPMTKEITSVKQIQS